MEIKEDCVEVNFNLSKVIQKIASGEMVCFESDDFIIFSRDAIDNGQVCIELPPVERLFDAKSKLFECANCGDCVSGIAKYCPNCGRRFEDD